jgi:hypothetical protein
MFVMKVMERYERRTKRTGRGKANAWFNWTAEHSARGGGIARYTRYRCKIEDATCRGNNTRTPLEFFKR